jgi:hypothetical protein
MTNSILKDIKRIIGMEDQLNSFGEWKNYLIIVISFFKTK